MASGTPPDASFTISDEKRQQIAEQGGRHYRGPGLRPTPRQASWSCPNCSHENTGRIEAGCANCPAGRPQPKPELKTMPTPPPGTLRPAPVLTPKSGGINKAELLNDIRQIVREELSQSLGAGNFELTGKEAYILRSLIENIDYEEAATLFDTTADALSTLASRLSAWELEHPDTADTATDPDPGVPA